MEVPHRYSYNPPLGLILLLFGLGFLWIGLEWFSSQGGFPKGFHLWIALIPIAVAFVVGVHRILIDRFLLLDRDSMILPMGPFTRRTTKIEYTSIRRVWQQHSSSYYGGGTYVLCVATEERTVKILPGFLPDKESVRTLEEFLNGRLLENTRPKKSERN